MKASFIFFFFCLLSACALDTPPICDRLIEATHHSVSNQYALSLCLETTPKRSLNDLGTKGNIFRGTLRVIENGAVLSQIRLPHRQFRSIATTEDEFKNSCIAYSLSSGAKIHCLDEKGDLRSTAINDRSFNTFNTLVTNDTDICPHIVLGKYLSSMLRIYFESTGEIIEIDVPQDVILANLIAHRQCEGDEDVIHIFSRHRKVATLFKLNYSTRSIELEQEISGNFELVSFEPNKITLRDLVGSVVHEIDF